MALHAGGGFALVGSGTGVDGIADTFRFLHQRATGDVDVITRLVSVGGQPTMQAGVMIRASLDADAPHAALIVSGDELGFVRRSVAGATTLSMMSAMPLPPVPSLWMKVERRGQVVSVFTSPDASAWTFVGSDAIDLPSSVFVGMAVASRHTSSLAWGLFDDVLVMPLLSDAVQGTDGATSESLAVAPATGERQRSPAARGSPPRPSTSSDAQAGASPRGAVPRRRGAPGASGADAPRVAVGRRGTSVPGSSAPAEDATTPSTPSTSPQSVPPAPSRWAVFTPSVDHDWNVDGYRFEVISAGTSVVVATQDLGKPPVVDGECRVDVGTLLNGLQSGTYVGVLRAVNARGASSGTQSAPFTR